MKWYFSNTENIMHQTQYNLKYSKNYVINTVLMQCFFGMILLVCYSYCSFINDIEWLLLLISTGDRIGIIWKPHTFLPKRFSVLETRLRLVMKEDTKANNDATNASTTVLNSVELIAMMLAEFDGMLDNVFIV